MTDDDVNTRSTPWTDPRSIEHEDEGAGGTEDTCSTGRRSGVPDHDVPEAGGGEDDDDGGHANGDADDSSDDSDDDDDDDDLAFARLDLTGVDFDADHNGEDHSSDDEDREGEPPHHPALPVLRRLERRVLFVNAHRNEDVDFEKDVRELVTTLAGMMMMPSDHGTGMAVEHEDELGRLSDLCLAVGGGRYVDVLRSDAARCLLGGVGIGVGGGGSITVARSIREATASYMARGDGGDREEENDRDRENDVDVSLRRLEAELVGVAALNLFLQLNYTGPTIDDGGGDAFRGICPHDALRDRFPGPSSVAEAVDEADSSAAASPPSPSPSKSSSSLFHNAVLAELAAGGEWPHQRCEGPYFLLLARAILKSLAWGRGRVGSSDDDGDGCDVVSAGGGGVGGFDWQQGRPRRQPSPRNDDSDDQGLLHRHLRGAPALATATTLPLSRLWSARAAVAHRRLLSTSSSKASAPSPDDPLWDEVKAVYESLTRGAAAMTGVGEDEDDDSETAEIATRVELEAGLAMHHFGLQKEASDAFRRSLDASGMTVEVTGILGRRTKFQQTATAQMTVRAGRHRGVREVKDDAESKKAVANVVGSASAREGIPDLAPVDEGDEPEEGDGDGEGEGAAVDENDDGVVVVEETDGGAGSAVGRIRPKKAPRMVEHAGESHLLEHVRYERGEGEGGGRLSTLDLAVLMALCLDVKNEHPADEGGLTAEQMGAYLERVLRDTSAGGEGGDSRAGDGGGEEGNGGDWMVYSNALLERAWLEFERPNRRERAILQMQALVDQHTNRLTATQSTFKSVQEDSAPAQERLKNLHSIVYPPRWAMKRDLAERYAKIGMVKSAAEIFEELELWDEVVECHRISGNEGRAEEIVRERLRSGGSGGGDSPRMWAALGDLTKDRACYEKALDLSDGRFSSAHVALGRLYFDEGDLDMAAEHTRKALDVKPLNPAVWFFYGTINMRRGDWEGALRAFSEVVQQEPEEGDAWANIAAVHMHQRNPDKAYPALVESLKQNRSNWRVWWSKLYTCLDLGKYDEAIQACHQLIDFRAKKNASSQVPELEEKCIRAIVGGSILAYDRAVAARDTAAIDSTKRTLDRVRGLLEEISSTMKSKAWVWECQSILSKSLGKSDEVLDNLMKEHRALQAVDGWESDPQQISRVATVALQISALLQAEGSKESLTKCKYLLNRLIKKVESGHVEENTGLQEVTSMMETLAHIEQKINSKA